MSVGQLFLEQMLKWFYFYFLDRADREESCQILGHSVADVAPNLQELEGSRRIRADTGG